MNEPERTASKSLYFRAFKHGKSTRKNPKPPYKETMEHQMGYEENGHGYDYRFWRRIRVPRDPTKLRQAPMLGAGTDVGGFNFASDGCVGETKSS